LVLVLALRVFLRVLWFYSLHKNTPNSNSTRVGDPHENQLRLMWLSINLVPRVFAREKTLGTRLAFYLNIVISLFSSN